MENCSLTAPKCKRFETVRFGSVEFHFVFGLCKVYASFFYDIFGLFRKVLIFLSTMLGLTMRQNIDHKSLVHSVVCLFIFGMTMFCDQQKNRFRCNTANTWNSSKKTPKPRSHIFSLTILSFTFAALEFQNLQCTRKKITVISAKRWKQRNERKKKFERTLAQVSPIANELPNQWP